MRYAQEGKASQEIVDAFATARELWAAVGEAERALAELEKERAAIAHDQSRIRENIGSIDRTSELYSRYVQKLSEQETRLEEIVLAIGNAAAERDRREHALEEYLDGLSVE
jgi:DNA repair ATPase RecN